MEQKQPLLSICILTYNRATLLKEALLSILGQATGLEELVEVIVSDNVSTDETSKVVAELRQGAKLNVRYYKNEKNLGFDGNCLIAVERAAGRHVWLFGDDDLLADGVLKIICRELESSPEIDVFLGEKQDFFKTINQPMKERRVMSFDKPKVFDFRKPQVLDQYFCQNKKLIAYLNFISIIVFRRSSWLRVKGKDKYLGSGYIHVFVLQSLLWGKNPGCLKYLPAPLAQRRWGSDPAYDLEKRFLMEFQIFSQIARDVFFDEKYVWLIDDLIIRNDGFSWAVRLRISQPWRFITVNFPYLLKRFWDHPLLWLKIFPLLFVPSFILRLLRGTYRVFVKGEPVGLTE
ncbi:MAG: glycosyltransferase family 2 protein [bacterium]